METKFLFMDEKYADTNAPRRFRLTSLVGVLAPASTHRQFRERFYTLVSDVLGRAANMALPMPEIHACDLFKNEGADDEQRFRFFEGIIRIALELEFKVFRTAVFDTIALNKMCRNQHAKISLCFFYLKCELRDEFFSSSIWPVMEIEGSSQLQDNYFAGVSQHYDYMVHQLKGVSFSIDNTNIGEQLYMTKRNGYCAVTDCVAYMLQAHQLHNAGYEPTKFRSRIVDIASDLLPAVALNQSITV